MNKPLWESPWAYMESFLISFGLVLIGFLLEFSIPNHPEVKIVYPLNLILGLCFVALVILLYFLLRKIRIIRFLSGIPASIGAVVAFAALVILMGISPQVPMQGKNIITTLKLNDLTSSWSFLLINLYVLLVLGLVILQKLERFKRRNWGFICSHLGLWITIFTVGLGAGDLQRLRMDLHVNKTEWKAYDGEGKYYEMPLAIHLNHFQIDEFHPKLAVVENSSGKLYEASKPSMIMIEKKLQCKLHQWNVEVSEFYASSGRSGDRYYQMFDYGAAPAAFVKVTTSSSDTLSGWISCGSFNHQHESLKLNRDFSLLMTVPEPRKFSSEVTIFTPDGSKVNQTLEVNKSYSVNGWKIYQLSYDEKMGKYSELSIVELVKDPWQIYVYIGVFLMMIGSVYMFWQGSKLRQKATSMVLSEDL
ncbi:cytochrome c biogenesis protein ResB [Ancylomarina longa]|nr:cytochrome c biogenesis protein ResB [Ancylomarina longa]